MPGTQRKPWCITQFAEPLIGPGAGHREASMMCGVATWRRCPMFRNLADHNTTACVSRALAAAQRLLRMGRLFHLSVVGLLSLDDVRGLTQSYAVGRRTEGEDGISSFATDLHPAWGRLAVTARRASNGRRGEKAGQQATPRNL